MDVKSYTLRVVSVTPQRRYQESQSGLGVLSPLPWEQLQASRWSLSMGKQPIHA